MSHGVCQSYLKTYNCYWSAAPLMQRTLAHHPRPWTSFEAS